MQPTVAIASASMWGVFVVGLLLGIVLAVTWALAVRQTRWAAAVTAVATVVAAAAGLATFIATAFR